MAEGQEIQGNIFDTEADQLLDTSTLSGWTIRKLNDINGGDVELLVKSLADSDKVLDKTDHGLYLTSKFVQVGVEQIIKEKTDNRLKKYEEDSDYQDLLLFQRRFLWSLTPTFVAKIDGASLEDLTKGEIDDVSLTNSFRYLIAVHKINRMQGDEIISRSIDQNDEVKDYRGFASTQIDLAAHHIAIADLFGNEQIQNGLKTAFSKKNLGQQIIGKSLDLVNRLTQVKERILAALLDPYHSDHTELKTLVEENIEKDSLPLFLALLPLRMSALKNLYRKSKEFAEKGIETDFYEMLAYETEEISDFSFKGFGVLTKRDEPLIVKNGEYGNIETVDDQSLRDSISGITQSQREKTFLIEETGNIFEGSGLEKPESIAIDFGDGSPFQFNIAFVYGKADGSPLAVVCEYDLRKDKNTFDWSFIESPEELSNLHAEIKRTTLRSLQFLEEAAKKPKPQETRAIQKNGQPKIKREKEIREAMPRLPWKQTRRAKIETPLTTTRGSAGEREKIKYQIETSEDPKNLFIGNVSTADQSKINEGIAKFNEKGLGRFKMLIQPDEDGEPLYCLDVRGTDARGGARILMKEKGSEKGLRRFYPKAIGIRKDIYRRFGI